VTPPRSVRVALVESSFGLSGSTLSLCALVKRLDRERFTPHVIVSRPEHEAYARARLGPEILVARISPREGLKAARWARRGRLVTRLAALLDLFTVTLPYALALRRFIRANAIELVHHNNGFDVATVVLCRVLGIPLVAYQRGDEWNSWVVRRLAPLASRYIANSEKTGRDLLALGIPAPQISVIYPPVDLADFAPGRGDASAPTPSRDAFGVKPEAPCFGIVGQLQEWKGQKVFLRAARRVLETRPDARAWVIGAAPAARAAYAEELRALARSLGIADRVVFTGFVSDVPGHIRLLDVVVHASTYPEPFGRVIVEAMMVGRPVVASDAGGPREIIEPGRTGLLVPPGDDAAMGAAILRLIDDPRLRADLADAARGEALRRFSAERHAREVEEVYARVLADDAGGVPERRSGIPAPFHDGGHR
jgi:glycosyltransferase involved in cell wall biosynthesis